jgi:hypothetical protein
MKNNNNIILYLISIYLIVEIATLLLTFYTKSPIKTFFIVSIVLLIAYFYVVYNILTGMKNVKIKENQIKHEQIPLIGQLVGGCTIVLITYFQNLKFYTVGTTLIISSLYLLLFNKKLLKYFLNNTERNPTILYSRAFFTWIFTIFFPFTIDLFFNIYLDIINFYFSTSLIYLALITFSIGISIHNTLRFNST